MRRWAATVLLFLAAALAAAAELQTASGKVEQLTRVETIGAESEPLLLVQLMDGDVFAFPGVEHLPAGSGVEIEIDYVRSEDPGRVPEACAARLIGLPVMIDGEERMQPAQRPVSIFVSESEDCR